MFGSIEVKDQVVKKLTITTVLFGLLYEKIDTEYYGTVLKPKKEGKK